MAVRNERTASYADVCMLRRTELTPFGADTPDAPHYKHAVCIQLIHRSSKCKAFTCLCNRLVFAYVTFVLSTTAWLTVPDRKQPTVFHIETVDTGMVVWNRLNTFDFTDMSSFSPDDRNANIVLTRWYVYYRVAGSESQGVGGFWVESDFKEH